MFGQNEHLIFLPGMVCDQRLWEFHMEELEEEHDVSFVDLYPGKDIQDYFEAIHHVMRPDSTLIGFSMGGYVANEYTLQFPERIKRLLLVGADPRGFTAARIQQRKRVLATAKEKEISILPDEQLPFYVHPNQLNNKSLTHKVQAMAQTAGRETYLHQMQATLHRTNRLNQIKTSSVPVWSVMSAQDQIAVPHRTEELTAHGIDLTIIEECGHMIPLEQPEELLKVIQRIIQSS